MLHMLRKKKVCCGCAMTYSPVQPAGEINLHHQLYFPSFQSPISKKMSENAPITENMIAKAVEDAGGSVTENGFYPINGEIEDILISELEKIEEDKERR